MNYKISKRFQKATFIIVVCTSAVFLFPLTELTYLYAGDAPTLNLATGMATGIYHPIGEGLKEAAKKAGITINVMSSQGSVENLQWLKQGKAQLCLAQSDTVYDAYHGIGKFSERNSNIKALASLYLEAIHIVVRNPLHIRKMDDLKGKRVSVGPSGSGTESNARLLLEASGIALDEIRLLNLSLGKEEGQIFILEEQKRLSHL
jgi:hypothetical protein